MDDDRDHRAPSTAGTPRWVKVFGGVLIALVLLIIAAMLIGGGDHGPSRHMPAGDPGERAVFEGDR
ncbi:MAG: hypothetical protein GEU94_06815 [Micromonosporaceae bacterium]|nr:hypothetical protein [Micromonosporaceae bacterium]